MVSPPLPPLVPLEPPELSEPHAATVTAIARTANSTATPYSLLRAIKPSSFIGVSLPPPPRDERHTAGSAQSKPRTGGRLRPAGRNSAAVLLGGGQGSATGLSRLDNTRRSVKLLPAAGERPMRDNG